MKHQKSNLNPQTEIEKLRSKFFKNGINHYKVLMKEGVKRFDKSGDLEIVNEDRTGYKQSGDKFIEDLIKYFESKDSGPYYRMCADLKNLLREYFFKFPHRKYKSSGLTPIEKAKLDFFYAHLHAYHSLKRYGTNLFEKDGTIKTKYENNEYTRDGRDYILKVINFFIDKDEPHYYMMAAKLKTVLDSYLEKFDKKKIDNI